MISEREVIDFKTRATYLDMAYRLLGSYKHLPEPPGGFKRPMIFLPAGMDQLPAATNGQAEESQ